MRRYSSFLIRHWQLSQSKERVDVEHVQSGQRATFTKLPEMLRWIEEVELQSGGGNAWERMVSMTTERLTGNTVTAPEPYGVGDQVEDVALPTLDGGEGRLADYRGKTVLLVFTATWCPYCGAEAPFLEQEIYQRYRARGVEVIAIDVKEPPEVMRPFRDRYGWTFPVWLDTTGELGMRFAPQKEGLPPEVAIINAHFILDAEGRVRYREYLNMERFDARARTVAGEIEKVLGLQ